MSGLFFCSFTFDGEWLLTLDIFFLILLKLWIVGRASDRRWAVQLEPEAEPGSVPAVVTCSLREDRDALYVRPRVYVICKKMRSAFRHEWLNWSVYVYCRRWSDRYRDAGPGDGDTVQDWLPLATVLACIVRGCNEVYICVFDISILYTIGYIVL